MNEKEKLHNELEENYEKIVEMLSNGNFLQLNGKAINLTELNEYINAQQEEIERLKDDNKYLNKVNIELSSEKNRLNNIINGLDNTIENLNEVLEKKESIIKEAIDYIEIIQYNESYGVKEKDYLNLLDILKGVDKE